MEMREYLIENLIEFEEIDSDLFVIDGFRYLYIEPKDDLLFHSDFTLILSPVEEQIITDFYCFEFGGRYYHTEDPQDPELIPLKFLGTNKPKLGFNYSFLGVHGGYELLNGSRLYDDWAKKAKFLGVHALGICERNTLAGALLFQKSCEKFGVKPVIGEEIAVLDVDNYYQYYVKLFPKDEEGWRRLLLINKKINVDNSGDIGFKDFTEFIRDGNFNIVLDPKYMDYEKAFPIELNYDCYYQLDPVEFVTNTRDEWYLNNLRKFVRSHIQPIAISDAYYLDKEDSHIKKQLNTIANEYDYESTNQYFRSIDQYFNDVIQLFDPEDETAVNIFMAAIQNVNKVANEIDFRIPTGGRHLPKYILTKEEKEKYGDSDNLFWAIIEEGLTNKIPQKDHDEYIDRLQEEYRVIKAGDVIDYFLILWDIISWSRRNDIIVGIARGSAGGSLISMLMGITEIDPIKFNLLFSRFLNEGRITRSLPDIDTDFEADKRHLVKEYMEERYGADFVCSVGTYTTLQVKGILKDFSRLYGAKFDDVNMITRRLSGSEDFTELFRVATTDKRLKRFILEYPDVINVIQLVYGQPKASSIHACAMIIFPDEGTMYEHVPMRSHDGEIVSEWEGSEIEDSGYLKEDILGVKQLEKFGNIIRLIRENHKEDIQISEIPLDCQKTYNYFKKGWNSDVFHFGSPGLTQYCRELKPDDIEDLIAGISLYRPGAMESNYHNEFIKLREGGEVEYMWGSEPATRNTYGLLVYQEQIMQIFIDVGKFTDVEADDVRRAMVRMDREILAPYRDIFIKNAIEAGCPTDEAKSIWVRLERFAAYGFNRSHAAAYAITGYISQWFKVNYPIEFWATAFKFARDDQYSQFISEIYSTGEIDVVSPDINLSGKAVAPNFETNSIHWGFLSIRDVGDVASDQIIEIRDSVGKFFTFEDFVKRNTFKGSKVNRRHIEHLVLCGAFDKIEGIGEEVERLSLINDYYKITNKKNDSRVITDSGDFIKERWWWMLQQKMLCGIAFFNFGNLSEMFRVKGYKYVSPEEIGMINQESTNRRALIGGYVSDVIIKDGKRGSYADIVLESNYNFVNVKIWTEQWDQLKDIISRSEGKLMFINGSMSWDEYKGMVGLTANNSTECYILG